MQAHNQITGAYVNVAQLLALRFARPSTALANARVVGNRAGAKLSNVKGRGVDLAEVRVYQPGDDVRSIDWHVTARTNTPHTKVFREERERPTLIVTDQTQNMFFGSRLRLKSVAAAETAAHIAWQTLAAGDRVGGVVLGNDTEEVHRPYRTTKSVARYLNAVAVFNQSLSRESGAASRADLTDRMLHVRRLARSNHRVVLISDFAGDLQHWQDHLQSLAKYNQVQVVHIYDVIEQMLPPADHYLVTNGKSRLSFYSGNQSLRQRYARQFTDRSEQLNEFCRHESMAYQLLATHESLDGITWI